MSKITTYSERLKYFVTSQNLQPSFVAKKLGISPQNFYKYYGDGLKYALGTKYILSLMELGLNPDWYIFGEEQMLLTLEDFKRLILTPEFKYMDTDIITPQKRLKKFVDKKLGNIIELAKALNIDQDRVYDLKNAGIVIYNGAYLLNELSTIGLNTNWYLTGKGIMTNNAYLIVEPDVEFNGEVEYIKYTGMTQIPLIDSAFPCGVPETNPGNIIYVSVRKEFVAGMKNPYMLRCKGSSMAPKIEEGDEVIAETIEGDISKVHNNDIVVAYINNEHTIKRFFRENGNYMLIPDNIANHRPYLLQHGDELSIIGVVKKVLKSV